MDKTEIFQFLMNLGKNTRFADSETEQNYFSIIEENFNPYKFNKKSQENIDSLTLISGKELKLNNISMNYYLV